jgi:hypothetical protein
VMSNATPQVLGFLAAWYLVEKVGNGQSLRTWGSLTGFRLEPWIGNLGFGGA